jgi:hypothetical protein
VFCLAWCHFLCDVCIFVLCLNVIPLPPGKNPSAFQLNNNIIPPSAFRRWRFKLVSWRRYVRIPAEAVTVPNFLASLTSASIQTLPRARQWILRCGQASRALSTAVPPPSTHFAMHCGRVSKQETGVMCKKPLNELRNFRPSVAMSRNSGFLDRCVARDAPWRLNVATDVSLPTPLASVTVANYS